MSEREMGRANHHSLASIGRKAARHLDYHAEHDSVVKPPIKVMSAMAHRWADQTKSLEIPKPRAKRAKSNSKYAWRKQTYPAVQLIA
jgi:hypothetical protein